MGGNQSCPPSPPPCQNKPTTIVFSGTQLPNRGADSYGTNTGDLLTNSSSLNATINFMTSSKLTKFKCFMKYDENVITDEEPNYNSQSPDINGYYKYVLNIRGYAIQPGHKFKFVFNVGNTPIGEYHYYSVNISV